MTLKETVDKYLTDNFKNIEKLRNLSGFSWNGILKEIEEQESLVGELFTLYENGQYDKSDREYVRSRFTTLRSKAEDWASKVLDENKEVIKVQAKEDFENLLIKGCSSSTLEGKFKFFSGKEDKEKGTKEFHFTADNIPTEEEIVEHFSIDLTKYKISQIWHKTTPSGKYSISVNLQALRGAEAGNYTEKFDKFIENYNKAIFVNQTKSEYAKQSKPTVTDSLYLISLSDLHIGNYQKEGYLEKLKTEIYSSFNMMSSAGVAKIVILNTGDMLHTNGSQETTFGGTQLDSELAFEDAFTQGLDLTTSLIDYASDLALSVTFVNVRGNHSFDTEYCLGEALKKIYQKSKNVEILNQRDSRIYYYWNNNAFLFTHGDKAVERLPLLFATEGKESFQQADNHHILLGHTHHNSSKQFVNDRKEYAGIEVRVLGSPTSNDQWHKQNGFVGNKKSIVSMLFSPEQGKYAEFNFKLFK